MKCGDDPHQGTTTTHTENDPISCRSLNFIKLVIHGPTWMGFGSAKGNSASMGMTQGEMVVPKFFPRKGPSGTYSHAWMSLAVNRFKITE